MDAATDTDKRWQVVEAYRPALLQQAQAILGNVDDAEDAVQETFVAATRYAQLPTPEILGSWLHSLNRWCSLKRLRGKRRHSRRMQVRHQQIPEDTFTTGGFSRLELKDWLQTAMKSLPPHLREIVKLRYWDHLSYKEIAARLNMPIGNVGRLLLDASIHLFEKLGAEIKLNGNAAPNPDAETQQVRPVDPR